MMKSGCRGHSGRPAWLAAALLVGAVATASCSYRGADVRQERQARPSPVYAQEQMQRGRRKIGKPYQVGGRTYVPRHQPGYDTIGHASWYGPGFEGRATANGERFDSSRMTGAHPTLPLPSLVRVTNLANGRQVVVRINDRGPFVRGRIIDLSRRAAMELGFVQAGMARVRVQYIGPARL